MINILIFGGTGEARELAARLVALGHDVTSSLAGRTQEPIEPEGAVRIGGFGDMPRLCTYLRDESFDTIVDATHPFAEKMPGTIVAACQTLDLPLIRLCRPQWTKPEGANWVDIANVNEVRNHIPDDAILLVTTGHKALGELALPSSCTRIIRLIEQPDYIATDKDRIILDRPPYSIDGELALMREYGVTHLLSKNSGGDQTRAKIDAAAQLGIPTFMVRRPVLPPAANEVSTIDAALAIIQERTS